MTRISIGALLVGAALAAAPGVAGAQGTYDMVIELRNDLAAELDRTGDTIAHGSWVTLPSAFPTGATTELRVRGPADATLDTAVEASASLAEADPAGFGVRMYFGGLPESEEVVLAPLGTRPLPEHTVDPIVNANGFTVRLYAPGTAPAPRAQLAVDPVQRHAAALRSGVPVTLQSNRPAHADIALRARGRALARKVVPAVEAARAYELALRLTATGRRVLRPRTPVRATLRVRLADDRGRVRTQRRVLRLVTREQASGSRPAQNLSAPASPRAARGSSRHHDARRAWPGSLTASRSGKAEQLVQRRAAGELRSARERVAAGPDDPPVRSGKE